MSKLLRSGKNKDYYNLIAKASDYVVDQVNEAFKSFFSLRKKGIKSGKPKYLKKDGRNKITFYKQCLSKKTYKREGLIHLSKTNIKFKTRIPFEKIQQVTIVPMQGFYKILVIYKEEEKQRVVSNNYAAIDLGVNNLATIVTNVSSPFIINGKPLKSINQRYNKRVARLKSKLQKGKKTSKQIRNITNKRNRRVEDQLHKASRKIVDSCLLLRISTIIIGHNKGWKQKTKLGKRNNQTFVQIPHFKLIEKIKHKSQLEGIEVIVKEESYTSKCSFLDNEEIKKHDSYKGKRIKRGLFQSSTGKLLNADVNAAYNIMKKHLGINISSLDSVQVCSTPKVLKF